MLNSKLKLLPLLLVLASAFSLQPSAFAQNPITFQPGRRPSGSLNVTNVNAFSPEFTNFGGTISLVHPPPPGAVGTNDFNTSQFAWTTARKISIKSGALTTNLVMSGSPKITNNSDLAVLQFATSNHNASLGIDTASGQVELIGDNGFVFDSAIGSQLFKTAGSQWQLFGDTFSPGSSNLAHVGTALQPLADMWITDNQITATNGVLYLNGIPIVSSPWTDDGTSIFPTANPSAMQLADDGSGVNFGIPIDGLARNFRFATDDGTNASLVLFQNTTTNMEVLFQYQPDYNGSGTIGNFDFRLIDDGASNGLSMFSMMSGGQYTFIVSTNGGASFGVSNAITIHPDFPTLGHSSLIVRAPADGTQIRIYSQTGSPTIGIEEGVNSDLYLSATANGPTIEFASLSSPLADIAWLDPGQDMQQEPWHFGTRTNLTSGLVHTTWANSNNVIATLLSDGSLTLSGQTNLIGMSAGGQLTVDGVAVGGGSQTPWTSDIDAATFAVTNLTRVLIEEDTLHFNLVPYGPSIYDDNNTEIDIAIDEMTSKPALFCTFLGDLVFMSDPQDFNGYGRGRYLWSSTDDLSSGLHTVWSDNTNRTMMQLSGRLGGAQVSLANTNGLGGLINVYAYTNAGTAYLVSEGSNPSATVPIDETSGAYVFPNTVTTNLVIPLVATIRITNGLVMAVTGP